MLALTFDPASKHLTCVYNDHSVYVWDVKDVRNAVKLYSALYHSGSVWSVEVRSPDSRNIRSTKTSYRLLAHSCPPSSPSGLSRARRLSGLSACVLLLHLLLRQHHPPVEHRIPRQAQKLLQQREF